MPICTSCTHRISFLYTVYESEYNLRLEQCPSCHEFVDPYVEHDSLTILLDLILLKRGVYRHLLFNSGVEPRRLVGRSSKKDASDVKRTSEDWDRWVHIIQLGIALIALDAFIRWSYLNPNESPQLTPWTKKTAETFLRFFIGTAAETIAFHGGITFSCYVIMKVVALFGSPQSHLREEFRLSLIPLSLFYSSLTKLFLLLLLTIWLPASSSTPPRALPSWVSHLWNGNSSFVTEVFEMLDDDKLDREWIVRNVVGGMSAGFALRVILDIHPLFTTVIILAGWAAKNFVATFVSGWVGGDATAGEAWLAYSVP